MSSTNPESRRRRRFSADQARAALLEAGLELLNEKGVANGLSRVTLADAVVRSGVPRPSAYRLYTDGDFDPQDQYRNDLLLFLLGGSGLSEQTDLGLATLTEATGDFLDQEQVGTDELAFVLREGIRQATNIIWQSTSAGEAASRATAISLVMDPDPYEPLLEAYRQRWSSTVGRLLDFYQLQLDLFGMRIRPPHSLEALASIVALAVDQVWDGTIVYGREPNLQRPTGVDGAMMAWTPFGVTVEGLVLVMVEEDPAAPRSARITAWLES